MSGIKLIIYYFNKLFQAPTESTVNGIVEMMFKKNVGTLVLLAEQTNHGITWLECFPINTDRCSFDIYTVVKVTDYGTLHAGTHIVDFYITNGSKKVPFRLLHYKDWPERGNFIFFLLNINIYRQATTCLGIFNFVLFNN